MTIDESRFEFVGGFSATHPERRPGGQHVGVSSAIMVRDPVSGIAVTVSSERSQMRNKLRALAPLRLYLASEPA